MELKINQYKFGERPVVTRGNREILERLGEERIRKLVHDHYDLLRQSEINHLFPQEDAAFKEAQIRSADFFVQALGGYPYYKEKRGDPKLAMRHRPFAIDAQARKVWLSCYQQLLPQLDLPKELIESYWNYLNVFSAWMVNQE